MTSASWMLQQAIVASLTAHAPLATAVTGVFDHAPDDQPMPYLTLGDDVVSDWSTKDASGTEHRIVLHIWSRAPGRREAKQLMALAQDALLAQSPQPADRRLINLRFLQASVLVSDDGLIHHGVIEYRARLCPV